jgi:hypothetical protein
MKFTITVNHTDSKSGSWTEDYNRPDILTLDKAKAWAERTIGNFNKTLRPRERSRILLEIVEQENDAVARHDWRKTNLVTIISGKRNYDKMICSRCGVTGKRYGLGQNGIERDSKFRAKKYETCSEDL